jgi:Domain of Unknown Function with PDB structure (DUF3857)/Transglutaminase-like superfamily
VNKRRWVVVLAMAVAFAAAGMWRTRSVSGDEWLPISPEELKMTSLPEAPGAPAVILYRQVDRDDGRTPHENNYVRIKIFTEEGRKYANVEIPFLKESSNVRGVRARTIRPDGSIVPFDGKVLEQTIVKAKGLKYVAKTFNLPDVQVGSMIEYHYSIDLPEGYVYDSRWVLSNELFTKKAKFTLKANPDFSLRWAWPLGLPAGSTTPKKDGDVIRMESQNIPAFQLEDYMPPETSLKFRVDFVYSDEQVPEKDAAKFWKNVGKKQNDKVESFVNKKKAMEQAVAETVSAGDSPEVKLQKIYARVQQIRNISYEREKTEQELKRDKQKAAGNVEEVWKNGYGTGGQITWLFLAMARAAGFEASPVLISRRSETFFSNTNLNANELDDNIVQVKLDGKVAYFDPGTAFTPYGMLPWWQTMVTGLKLQKDGGIWVKTPLPRSNTTRIERKAELKLDNEGTLQGKLTVTYYGSEAQQLRMEERNEDDTSKKRLLEDMVRESVPIGIEVELTNQPNWKRSDPALVTEYTFKVPGWVSGAGKRALLPVGLFSNSEKGVFENAHRLHAVYFHYPYQKNDDIKIELPLGWKLGSLAKPVERDATAADYVMKVEEQGGVLHLTRTLRSDLMIVPKDNYLALRTFFETVRTGDEEQVVLQPGSAISVN